MDKPEILWTPPADVLETTHLGRWLGWVGEHRGVDLDSYAAAWDWSVTDLEDFWSSIWEYFDLIGEGAFSPVLAERTVFGAQWFPGLRLNWAENALRHAGDAVSVVGRSQTRGPIDLSGHELLDLVGRARRGLQALGVEQGSRVVAYLPNIPEALVLLLATASLGAIFSSCPPEFGTKAVIDRFGQIEPTVLVATDGYRHRGKAVERATAVTEIEAAIPSITATVLVPYLDPGATRAGASTWAELTSEAGELAFARVPFDHPLYVLYSSGTTGLPKPIVHGHGGIVLEHTKGHHLHHDLGPDDRFFWYSTTGWVMWNYLVSGLLTGASIVLFDGDPGYPDIGTLWGLAESTGTTVFGVSAPFLLGCRKAAIEPAKTYDLSRIRQVGSTGAPLPAEGFRWVYDNVGDDVLLVSASGGTDVCGAFVAAAPILPVTAGEMACRCLGAKVEAYDEEGKPVIGREGELVITEPMPSMPVSFWGDDGTRYLASYFERFDGVWTHGDWITITDRGTCTISGRSDATLNRGGVRLGTSDFYTVLESRPDVEDSLVVHLEDADGGVGELLLFVRLAEGTTLDDDKRRDICSEIRTTLSPRHVPDTLVQVRAIPRTLSGKKLEVPVKRLLKGAPPSAVASSGSLLDPAALDEFVAIAEAREANEGP